MVLIPFDWLEFVSFDIISLLTCNLTESLCQLSGKDCQGIKWKTPTTCISEIKIYQD